MAAARMLNVGLAFIVVVTVCVSRWGVVRIQTVRLVIDAWPMDCASPNRTAGPTGTVTPEVFVERMDCVKRWLSVGLTGNALRTLFVEPMACVINR